MPVYNAPIQDISFLLNDVLKLQQQDIPGYDALEPELLQAILEEGGKLASEVLAPLNASGDREGCHLENGVVRTPKGFKDAFDKVKDGGWTGLDCDPEFGGQGLPYIVATAIAEIFASANMAPMVPIQRYIPMAAQNKKQRICPEWSAASGPAR